MKKLIAVISVLLSLAMLAGCGARTEITSKPAPEPVSQYKTVASEVQGFSTLCRNEYSEKWDDEDGLYIYTENADSIPYVLIWRFSDIPVDAGQFLEESIYISMVEQYGDDMVSIGSEKEYVVGGKTLPGILFTYKVGEYTVESLRLIYRSGDDLINFTAKYISGEGDDTMEALNTAVKGFTDGKNSDASTEREPSETDAEPSKEKEVNIVPSESAGVQYEKYTDPSGYFTMDIPKGWTVTVGLPPTYEVDFISYAITVSDPHNADRRLYFNLNCSGMLKSEEARDWYNTNFPKTFGLLPAVTELSTAGFFSAIGEYYGYSDFSVTENIGVTPFGGDLLNATAVSAYTGKPIQGLFTATVTATDYYVQRDMFDYSKGMVDAGMVTVYTIVYETAPQEEFIDWQPVLDRCFSSLSFTDTFQSQRRAQWQSVLGTATYLFNTANEISDMLMSSWESRNTSYDVMSQKQSDATLGYDRVLDTETGEYYKADAGFPDSSRYKVVDDDAAYLTPSSGWIEWKN